MKFSVVIPTHDRAADLRETLQSVAEVVTAEPWEVIVVDNNSTDDTRAVVDEAARTFPVELRYLFEAEQGRSAALNAGIRASRGEIVVTADDDIRMDPRWLEAAAAALDDLGCDFAGGKMLPLWSGPRPVWMPSGPGKHWSVLGVIDHGPRPIEYGGRELPCGIMAFRRDAFARAGLLDNRLGRKAGTLLGQEAREWGLRARAAGLRGFYVPELVVLHTIREERLSKRYFRRWFYWHGVARAIMYAEWGTDPEAPERTTLDFSKVPHVAGVPRYLYRTALASLGGMLRAAARREHAAAFEAELWLWFFAGLVSRRWRDARGRPRGGAQG